MMGDPVYLVLLKADFTDSTCFKGCVKIKCEHKLVIENIIDKTDEKRLNLKLLTSPPGHPIQFTDLTLYFENAPKALKTKQFIEANRKKMLERKSNAILTYLQQTEQLA